ncbi:hypothetical protein MRB53_011486 [Persea americana]|uniref:Uncharacterized protein n=1 Tax=Persea americana TaxID=3435 RepID=A0ACC2LV57_PERAE|nr:hypothetical protein MRB53_011486 [Persea americana]
MITIARFVPMMAGNIWSDSATWCVVSIAEFDLSRNVRSILDLVPMQPLPGVLLLPRSPSQPSPDAAIVRRRPSGIVGEATAADCRRERKKNKNQTILTQTITLRPSLHDRRRRCSVDVPSSPPRSPATCPPSPLKKKTVTWAKALF